MKGREAFAIVGVMSVFAGGPALAHEFSEQADARARAITADTCQAYDEGGMVTEDTRNCLSNGWIPDGKALNTDEIAVGTPEEIVQGYARLEASRGRHFDPSGTIWWTLGGMAIGGFFVYKIEGDEEREAKLRRQAQEQPADEPEAETPPERPEPFEDDEPGSSD